MFTSTTSWKSHQRRAPHTRGARQRIPVGSWRMTWIHDVDLYSQLSSELWAVHANWCILLKGLVSGAILAAWLCNGDIYKLSLLLSQWHLTRFRQGYFSPFEISLWSSAIANFNPKTSIIHKDQVIPTCRERNWPTLLPTAFGTIALFRITILIQTFVPVGPTTLEFY